MASAFDSSTGHNHDGTTGGGAPISLSTATTGTLPVARGGTNATTASDARVSLGVAIGSDVQAYSAGLTSIGALTTAANKGIYTTASNTYATYDLSASGRNLVGQSPSTDTFPYISASNTYSFATVTSFARNLLDDTTSSSARSTLGLVIGTDVQAYNATLAAVAGGTYTGSSTITTVGTIATGTWSGTTIAVNKGGTGATTASDARTNLAASPLYPTITQKTGDFTFALVDDSALIEVSSASPITATVPANASVAFTTGTQILVARYGTGTVTFAPAGGVTIRSANSGLEIIDQYGMAVLIKIGTNEWLLAGNI